MGVLITNRTGYEINQTDIKKLLYRAQKIISLPDGGISLAVISKNEMREINRAHRGIDEPTDVLAFDYGEILLCPAHIKKKYGLISKRDVQMKMQELFAHGVVHIGGFDHRTKKSEAEMRKIEEKILKF